MGRFCFFSKVEKNAGQWSLGTRLVMITLVENSLLQRLKLSLMRV